MSLFPSLVYSLYHQSSQKNCNRKELNLDETVDNKILFSDLTAPDCAWGVCAVLSCADKRSTFHFIILLLKMNVIPLPRRTFAQNQNEEGGLIHCPVLRNIDSPTICGGNNSPVCSGFSWVKSSAFIVPAVA